MPDQKDLYNFCRLSIEKHFGENGIKIGPSVDFKLIFKDFEPGCHGNKTICPTHFSDITFEAHIKGMYLIKFGYNWAIGF